MLISCSFAVVCSYCFLVGNKTFHYCFEEFGDQVKKWFVVLWRLQMSTFYGIRKVSGGEWSDEEREQARRAWLEAEKQLVKKRKREGFDLKNIAVPLPDVKNLKKYTRDGEVKKFLEPFQTINPYRLRKPVEG
jgi:hypothetical protein